MKKRKRKSLLEAVGVQHCMCMMFLHPINTVSFLKDGMSSLMLASVKRHDRIVRILLSAGANVNLQDKVI